MSSVTTIPIASLLLGFVPVLLLIVIMRAWGLNALQAMYANVRMLVQLLLIGMCSPTFSKPMSRYSLSWWLYS